jgi:hypothetical protein
MTDSMCCSSVSLMPMWRAMNSLSFSSWLKGAADDINMLELSDSRFDQKTQDKFQFDAANAV